MCWCCEVETGLPGLWVFLWWQGRQPAVGFEGIICGVFWGVNHNILCIKRWKRRWKLWAPCGWNGGKAN